MIPLRRLAISLFCLCSLSALTGCGKDFNGFGDLEGWGGSTKGYGDVDESYKPVGLCSYTGGCMQEQSDDNSASPITGKRPKDTSGATAGDAN